VQKKLDPVPIWLFCSTFSKETTTFLTIANLEVKVFMTEGLKILFTCLIYDSNLAEISRQEF
jgi:hypothetical protein